MQKDLRRAVLFLGVSAFAFFIVLLAAGGGKALAATGSGESLWVEVPESSLPAGDPVRLLTSPHYRTLRLNQPALERLLSRAPREFTEAARTAPVVMPFPMPDGTFSTFYIEDSPIMEPELAARFPEIRTYRGQGIDDATATVRFDWTPAGFHAMVLSSRGTVYIDPYSRGETDHYISYFKRDFRRKGEEVFRCLFSEAGQPAVPPSPGADVVAPAPPFGATLRRYRLAMAATGEYTIFHGGTVAAGLAAITTTMNRVNAIYEREVAVRMVLIPNENLIIYTDPATDPYTNNNGFAMLAQNQANLDAVIGTANYDIGHVFSTGGGGVAFLRSPCQAAIKARGVTGLPMPVGDPFDVDYVAHEMGHQYGGNHTFNGTTGACGGSRVASAAYEPGSGSTIQAYAGICGAENLQPNSDDYFHAESLNEIIAFITGAGNVCAMPTDTGNNPPTVNAGADFTVPRSTPFLLTATGSDADGDMLTYNWEEMDLGAAAPPNTDNGNRPIFRSFLATTGSSRTFPKLSDILSNTATFGESLPITTRSMNFRATARDNRSGGGGTNFDAMVLNVRSDSGPFLVTQPNTAVTWASGSTQTVLWDVANTSSPPVSCANVRILLSTDGGNTFPTVLAASTPNDGSQAVLLPGVVTAEARVKVEAVGNVFFDISNVNFSILPGISINEVTVTEGNSGTVAAEFTVSLSTASGQTVTAHYATADGTATAPSDYQSTSGTVIFSPGDLTQPVTVLVNGDTLEEPDETFFVNLSAPANGTITDSQGLGTIRNDDGATVSGMSPTSGPSAGGTGVTITGTSFIAGSTVRIGGVLATNVTVVSGTQITATTPALPAGTLNNVVVTSPSLSTATLEKGWFADFLDVPGSHTFHDFVEKIFRFGITSGCGGGNYCPDASVSRDQMAVFLLRGEHGGNYVPPPATGTVFDDVPITAFAAAFIEQLFAEGITSGCSVSPPLYCPGSSVTRGQMAVFLLRAKLGSGYMPPPATGIFGDVPLTDPFVRFIEDLFNRGITSGCGGGNYCPNDPNTRGQMAVFLVRTFNLP